MKRMQTMKKEQDESFVDTHRIKELQDEVRTLKRKTTSRDMTDDAKRIIEQQMHEKEEALNEKQSELDALQE